MTLSVPQILTTEMALHIVLMSRLMDIRLQDEPIA